MIVDEHFVAFIDILGFSEKVKQDFSRAEIDEHSNIDSIRQAILAARALGDVDAQISVQQFSDSIIVSTKYNVDSFSKFVQACSKLQADLLKMKILVRGGMTYGKHFSDDGVVYSQALIDAYFLESQEAIHPRIILSPDIVSLIFPDRSKAEECPLICEDRDRHYFINFMSDLGNDEIKEIAPWVEAQRLKTRGRVAEKMAWLSAYLDKQ